MNTTRIEASENAVLTQNGDIVSTTQDPTATPPPAEPAVIYINGESHRGPRQRRVSRGSLVPSIPATVPSSVGIDWSVSCTSIDGPRSRKWGFALRTTMAAQRIDAFAKGDLVEIEIGIGENRFRLTGRASRFSTAYFWIDDLLAAGIDLHQIVNLVITAVHPASTGASVVTNGGAL